VLYWFHDFITASIYALRKEVKVEWVGIRRRTESFGYARDQNQGLPKGGKEEFCLRIDPRNRKNGNEGGNEYSDSLKMNLLGFS